jgi:intracellular multiplication protein IcmP
LIAKKNRFEHPLFHTEIGFSSYFLLKLSEYAKISANRQFFRHLSGQTLADQAQNTLHENFIGWAIMLVIFAVIAWLFWFFYDTEMRNVIRWIRYGEMWVVSLVAPENYTVNFRGQESSFFKGLTDTPKWAAEDLTRQHLSYFGALAMQPLRIPFVIGLLAMAGYAIFLGPKTKYRKSLDLDGLIERQSLVFPTISPFIDFNPSKLPPRAPGSPVPAKLPLFAEALGPEEWFAYNRIPAPDGKIDENKTAKAFSKQLGKRWQGAKALPPYMQILLASFCLKAARKRDESDEMLARIAKCWSAKKGLRLNKDRKLIKDARKILSNKKLAAETLAKANQAGFVTTAMLKALQHARDEGGVLAPAQFVWLRGHDRTLWYPLNNLGRHSFHMEALGAMAHYKLERMTQRPIPTPKVDGAVETMKGYFASSRARPIPPLDYSESEKRGIKKAT